MFVNVSSALKYELFPILMFFHDTFFLFVCCAFLRNIAWHVMCRKMRDRSRAFLGKIGLLGTDGKGSSPLFTEQIHANGWPKERPPLSRSALGKQAVSPSRACVEHALGGLTIKVFFCGSFSFR